MIPKFLTAKVAAVTAATLFSAGVAAAATGSLPDPVQSGVARAVAHVGVDLPRPGAGETESEVETETVDAPPSTTEPDPTTPPGTDAPPSTDAPDPTTPPVTEAPPSTDPRTSSTDGSDDVDDEGDDDGDDPKSGQGPDPSGSAQHGLCTAYFAGEGDKSDSDAVSFTNLKEAASEAGQSVEEFCADALSERGKSGDDHGKSDGDHGKPGDDDSSTTDVPTPTTDDSDRPGKSGDDHGKSDDGDDDGTPTTTGRAKPDNPGSNGKGNGNGGNKGKGGNSTGDDTTP